MVTKGFLKKAFHDFDFDYDTSSEAQAFHSAELNRHFSLVSQCK